MKKLSKEVLRIVLFSLFFLIILFCLAGFYWKVQQDSLAAERKIVDIVVRTATQTTQEYQNLKDKLDNLEQDVRALNTVLKGGLFTTDQRVQRGLGDIERALAEIKMTGTQSTLIPPASKDMTEELVNKGLIAFENGNYEKAQKQFSDALLNDIGNERIALYLSATQYMAGNMTHFSSERVKKTFEDAIRKYGNDPVFLRCLITQAVRGGAWKEAALHYQAILSERRLSEAECRDAAEIAVRGEEYRIAAEIYDMLGNISKERNKYLVAAAQAYFYAGDIPGAKLRLQECLAYDTNNKAAKALLEQIGGN